jgi:hypothetical protein
VQGSLWPLLVIFPLRLCIIQYLLYYPAVHNVVLYRQIFPTDKKKRLLVYSYRIKKWFLKFADVVFPTRKLRTGNENKARLSFSRIQ